jgi:elongation factor G
MSTELSAASAEFLGEQWHFLDCPGSVEFAQDTYSALMVADVAIVVCEPEVGRALTLAPLFHFLDTHEIPHMVFINKVDHSNDRVGELLEAMQGVSERPLALRHVPIREGEDITGYVDLVSERAYEYKPGEKSSLIELPDTVKDRNEEARQELLETLADFDDALLEQLLEDVVPPKDDIYEYLTRELQADRVVPVFLGAAEMDHGVRRLMKALRHEAPPPEATLERLGGADGSPLLQVFKTYHLPHTGKLSVARVWRGEVRDGDSFGAHRVSGLSQIMGHRLAALVRSDPAGLLDGNHRRKARGRSQAFNRHRPHYRRRPVRVGGAKRRYSRAGLVGAGRYSSAGNRRETTQSLQCWRYDGAPARAL